MKDFAKIVRGSIPLKICFSILLIETVLLAILGMYYTTTFNNEIDIAVHQKLLLPSVLMSERALNYDAVRERDVMSELLQEDVVKAFVVNTGGMVFYGSEDVGEGRDFHHFLSKAERDYFARDLALERTLSFDEGKGERFISTLAPIYHRGKLLGALYLQIDGSRISEKKSDVAFTFFMGALVTIVLTTALEALFVYKLIVPRIERTSRVLSKIEASRFSTRVEDYGVRDQIGRLMEHVDAMLSHLEAAFEEIRAAEKKYRDLFMSAREGIFRVTPDGRLMDGNPALADLLGFQSLDEMNACREEKLLRYIKDDEHYRELRSHLAAGGDVHNQELRIRRRDGKNLTVSLSIHKIFDAGATLKAYEGRVIDVTDHKIKERAEAERQAAEAVAIARLELVQSLEEKNRQLECAYEELKTTQHQLLKSERMAILGMTAGGVAHDLNNILMGITGYPELLLTEIPEDSPLRGPLEAIRTSGRRAAAVVTDMLTLSRDVASEKENVSVNRLVREYLESLEFQQVVSANPGVEVKTELKKGDVYAYCSSIHIQKVIMNLVTNGLEAVVDGGSLTISTSIASRNLGVSGKSGKEQMCCVLQISDTGSGICPENLDHIFDPFYTRKVMGKSGTGLGLTIVQNVVKQHDGSIEVRSDASGTTFTVYLPMGFETIQEAESLEGVKDYSGTEKILLVDDEPLQRYLGSRYLSTLGYSVKTLASGEEALLYLDKNRADLLILDMIMAPGISGLETYKRVLEKIPGQDAILVSGFSPDESVREAYDLGLRGFVPKPYSITQLARSVREALDD